MRRCDSCGVWEVFAKLWTYREQMETLHHSTFSGKTIFGVDGDRLTCVNEEECIRRRNMGMGEPNEAGSKR